EDRLQLCCCDRYPHLVARHADELAALSFERAQLGDVLEDRDRATISPSRRTGAALTSTLRSSPRATLWISISSPWTISPRSSARITGKSATSYGRPSGRRGAESVRADSKSPLKGRPRRSSAVLLR